jgi:hypothetical protein
MQEKMKNSEAWIRFSCALLSSTDLDYSEIALQADEMLKEYEKRFPPKNLKE